MNNSVKIALALLCGILFSSSGFGQTTEEKLPLIRPMLRFDLGFLNHDVSNMDHALEEAGYTTKTNFSLGNNWSMGVDGGFYIGKRHKVALSYDFSPLAGGDSNIDSEYSSLGCWYEFQVMKEKPLHLHLGLKSTRKLLNIRKPGITHATGKLSEFLEKDGAFSIVDIDNWNIGCELSLLYSFIHSNDYRISAQIGYLYNLFDDDEWTVVDTDNYESHPDLPKDNLIGVFMKLSFEFDLVNVWRNRK